MATVSEPANLAHERSGKGLAKLLTRRPIGFLIVELLQNAWDEAVGQVTVILEPVPGQAKVRLTVADDAPEGFTDLSHAYTLYAESKKKADPTRRARWNLGDKLVIAACEQAEIATTTGTVRFHADDTRTQHRARTDRGSAFTGTVRMTRAEMDEALALVRTLLPPKGVTTVINGEVLPYRDPARIFNAVLDTEIADAEGLPQAHPPPDRHPPAPRRLRRGGLAV